MKFGFDPADLIREALKDIAGAHVNVLDRVTPEPVDRQFRHFKEGASQLFNKAKEITPDPVEQIFHSPQELIQMALEGTQNYMGKKDEHEKQYKNYMKARQRNKSSIKQGVAEASSVPGAPPPAAPARSGSVQTIAQQMAAERGWTGPEWDALYDLVNKESSWTPGIRNPNSSARGLFQFIDSTARQYGLPQNATPEQEIQAGLQYIADRYTTPSRALDHWLARKPINGRDVGHWY